MVGMGFCHSHSTELRHHSWGLPLGTRLSGYHQQQTQEVEKLLPHPVPAGTSMSGSGDGGGPAGRSCWLRSSASST